MSHGDQLKSALGLSAIISVYGIATLAVIFLGPQFGVGYMWQAVIIGIILLTWPFALLINYARKRRERRKEAAAAAAAAPAQGAAPPTPAQQKSGGRLPAVAGTYEALTRGTEEVVQWLRGTKLSGSKNKADAVYALPWFLITGPATSGKTSLLLSSGLSFQVLPSQRAAEQHVIRPTPNCEFRITDQAVWLDTTGRYQTEGPDRDEWAALVETVKRHRRERPFDGLVIAVNTNAVLRWGDAELEQQAQVLRARLDEAVARAGVHFPVYVVFTHADAIEGFSDFFRSFRDGERTQVWGSTFPLAQSRQAHALFDQEFEHLYGRLLRRRAVQLETTPRPDEQLRIFKFPGRFRRARQRLGYFVNALFRPNPFAENPMLRGFYFTSSAGEGALGARYLSGRELFTQTLFHEVILRDRDVVAATQAQKRRPGLLRNILFALAAVLVLFFLVGMTVSFFNNRTLIADAEERGNALIEIRRITSKNLDDADAARKELVAAERIREVLAELNEYERTRPPLFMRFGLYTGDRINYAGSRPGEGSSFRAIYIEAVEQRFTKPVFLKMQEDLRAFASGQKRQPASAEGSAEAAASNSQVTPEERHLEQHYDLLKAYLMLGKPDKVEPALLVDQMRGYWRTLAPAGREEEALDQLKFYASQAHKSDVTHFEPEMQLVEQARRRLAAYPVVSRVYKRIVSDINQQLQTPVDLSTIASVRETNVGKVIDSKYSVPPAYTVEGYNRWKTIMESSAAEEFRRDDWVMGGQSTDPNFAPQKDELQSIYFRDYVAQWQRFLQEIRVREYKSKEEAEKTLRTLAGSTSPLDAAVREAARQTNLAGSAGGFIGWITSFFSRRADVGGTPVDREFRPLVEFASGKGKEDAVSAYRTRLNAVSDKLRDQTRSLNDLSKQMQAGEDRLGLRKARQEVADLLEQKGFNATPASQTAAKLLTQPLDNLNTLLVGTDFEQIEKAWQQLIARSWQPLETGYPFTEGGADASVAALANFLKPEGGELTKFFNERLKPYFEEADWSPKKEAAEKFTPEFLTFLKNARRLRDALFPGGGAAPNIEYQLTLAAAPADATVKIVIDGNALEQGQQAPPFKWPGNKSGATITAVLSGANAGQILEYRKDGEWGLLKMFAESGGGDGKTPPFNLSVNVNAPAAGSGVGAPAPVGMGGSAVGGTTTTTPGATTPARPPSVPVRLVVQPKSGTVFQRELFTSLRAPKRVAQQ